MTSMLLSVFLVSTLSHLFVVQSYLRRMGPNAVNEVTVVEYFGIRRGSVLILQSLGTCPGRFPLAWVVISFLGGPRLSKAGIW